MKRLCLFLLALLLPVCLSGNTVLMPTTTTVTAECGLSGVSCAAAYSLTHRIVSSATVAFNVSDTTGGPGHNFDIGFTSTGLINMAQLNTDCATLAGQACLLHTVYDQTGNGCDLTYPLADNAPIAVLAAYNLPVYLIGYQVTPFLVGHLEATSCASALGGNAAKSFIVSSNNFGSDSGAGVCGGLAENTPSAVIATMFTCAQYTPVSTVFIGFDLEGCSIQNPGCQFTDPLGSPGYAGVQQIIAGTYDGAGNYQVFENGTSVGTWAGTGSFASLATQNRMEFGSGGDNNQTGPTMIADYILNTGALSGAAVSAITTSWQALYAAQTPLNDPVDLQGLPGVGKNSLFTTYAYEAHGLRQLTASYMGALVNVCKGTSATCEDIPQDGSGNLSWSTAKSFCGADATSSSATSVGTALTTGGTITGTFSIGMQIRGAGFAAGTFIVSGTGPYVTNTSNTVSVGVPITGNDCRVQDIYVQAAQSDQFVAHNTGQDMTDSGTAANRPWLYFDPPGVTAGKGALYFNGAQGLCSTNTGAQAYNPLSAQRSYQAGVAERTGNFSGVGTILSGTGADHFIGFNTANLAFAEYGSGGAGSVTVAAPDGAMHAMGYMSGSGSTTTFYVDSSSNTSASASPGTYTAAQCIGVSNGINFPLTGYIEEEMTLSGAIYNSTQAAALIANQQAYWF